MTPPRHLWSGDWRRESAEASQRLAERRRPAESPSEPPVAEPPPRGPSALQRLWAAIRNVQLPELRGRVAIPAALRGPDAHRIRGAVLLGVAMLIAAVGAYAAVAALRSPSTSSPVASRPSSAPNHAPAWLGVDTAFFPSGAMVVSVEPGSPAATAGLQPGDLITEINGHPVTSPADLQVMLAGMHAGQQVQITYQQGPISNTVEVTLQARPAGQNSGP
jgi:membrane-associated protease RseP (regulator of RpoE activity)